MMPPPDIDDDQCPPGAFMDTLSPETRKRAVEIDARSQPAKPTLAEAVAGLLAVVRYVHQYGRLTSQEHKFVEAAIEKWEASK
jgi:hypothetical protein